MRKYIITLTMLVCNFSIEAQEKKDFIPDKFIGYGWIVGFPYDNAFILSKTPDKVPTVNEYFMQKDKFGIRVNEDENAISALTQGQFYPVKTRLGENDSLLIVPVMAYYSLQYGNVSTGNADSPKVGLRPYNEMLQVYTYKGNLDSVFYRIALDVDFKVRVISDKTR